MVLASGATLQASDIRLEAPRGTPPSLASQQTPLLPEGETLEHWEQMMIREALRRASAFRKERIPKFLDWFEAILARNPDGPAHLVGASITYADLSLFQVIDGLAYAFPRAMKRALPKRPHIAALRAAVAKRPRIKAYLASDRRLAFNEDDVFRHYPELDG